MKNFKVILFSLIVMMSGSLLAQPPGGGDRQGPPAAPTSKEIIKMVSEINETVGVSEETGDEILAVYQAHFEVVAEKLEAGRPNREDMEALEAKLVEDVEELLSDEEKEKYAAYVKEHAKDKPRR